MMFGLDRYNCPVPGIRDYAEDTGTTFTLLMNAYDTGQDYDNAMKYWVIDPDGVVAYESGVHQLDVDAITATVDELLLELEVADPPPAQTPRRFELAGVYPNPFNTSTTVRVAVPSAAQVTVTVHDILGRRVAVLADRSLAAGVHRFAWTPKTAAGLYFIRAEAQGFGERVERVVYLK